MKRGALIGPLRRAQVADQATQSVIGRAKALGHLHLRLAVNPHSSYGFVASVEGRMRFAEETTGKTIRPHEDSAV
jgi:hypothetical protein